MDIYDKIYEIYTKLKDNDFYCTNFYPVIDKTTIKCSRVTQFESMQPFSEIILRFENKKDNFDIGLFFNGKLYKYWYVENVEDFDKTMNKIIEVLKEKNLNKYVDLLL